MGRPVSERPSRARKKVCPCLPECFPKTKLFYFVFGFMDSTVVRSFAISALSESR